MKIINGAINNYSYRKIIINFYNKFNKIFLFLIINDLIKNKMDFSIIF